MPMAQCSVPSPLYAYASCVTGRALLHTVSRQFGHPDLRRVPAAHRGARRHGAGQELVRIPMQQSAVLHLTQLPVKMSYLRIAHLTLENSYMNR